MEGTTLKPSKALRVKQASSHPEDTAILALRDHLADTLDVIWEEAGPGPANEATLEILGKAIRHYRRLRQGLTQIMVALHCDQRCIDCINTNAEYCSKEGVACRLGGDGPLSVQ